MASQLGLSRLAVCYRRICDGRPVSEGELYPWTDWYETSRMDALTAVWPVAGENHRNEAAGAAEGDLCESQETVGGTLLVQLRWVVVEICFTLNLGSLFFLNTILAILVILHPQLTRMLQHFHYYSVVMIELQRCHFRGSSIMPVNDACEVYSLTSQYTYNGLVKSIAGHYRGSRARQLKRG